MLSANSASHTTSRSWSGNSRPNSRRTHRLKGHKDTIKNTVTVRVKKRSGIAELKLCVLTCHRFVGRSPAGWGACAAPRRASSPAGPGCGWLWSLWQQMALSPGAEQTGCWSASLLYPGVGEHNVISISLYKHQFAPYDKHLPHMLKRSNTDKYTVSFWQIIQLSEFISSQNVQVVSSVFNNYFLFSLLHTRTNISSLTSAYQVYSIV